jgi:hypothetical protein
MPLRLPIGQLWVKHQSSIGQDAESFRLSSFVVQASGVAAELPVVVNKGQIVTAVSPSAHPCDPR